jgi:hypothetical protein
MRHQSPSAAGRLDKRGSPLVAPCKSLGWRPPGVFHFVLSTREVLSLDPGCISHSGINSSTAPCLSLPWWVLKSVSTLQGTLAAFHIVLHSLLWECHVCSNVDSLLCIHIPGSKMAPYDDADTVMCWRLFVSSAVSSPGVHPGIVRRSPALRVGNHTQLLQRASDESQIRGAVEL